MISERIEGRLDLLFISDLARIGAECLKKGVAKGIAGEQSVQITSGDAAVLAHAAIATAGQAKHRSVEAWSGRSAEVHLVTFDWHPG